MEQKTIYYISEAAKKVQVESHVLRYWEDELQLPIKRNEMGHRYYTDQNIRQLQEIKSLKEQGLQLKAIRTVLFKTSESQEEGNKTETRRDKLMDMVKDRVEEKTREKEEMLMNKTHKYVVALSSDKKDLVQSNPEQTDMDKNQKAARLQYLLQHMITEAVRSANRELCTEVKDSILKELDYQFRMQEERDEEHWKKEEEHYRKIDEMIRERHKPKDKLGIVRKNPKQ
ncbi:MAG: MerR family transcriptional regulator [Lachnospiraceae bacterium]|nr:MerR family transcriptional regulator [Lachnospiraceae bacterium]